MSTAMFAELAAAFVPPLTKRLVESRAVAHGPVAIEGRFSSRDGAEAAAHQYLRSYSPLGYGTHLAIRQEDEQWVVYGGRADSCE